MRGTKHSRDYVRRMLKAGYAVPRSDVKWIHTEGDKRRAAIEREQKLYWKQKVAEQIAAREISDVQQEEPSSP